ncbi:MAG: hypothetical protein KatS3mg101_0326 [Patescibacteria group bacterium]|nr:MAG: hypothetical protein KatS3mg101_0326 [Patescibacteria group bacterium]
MCVVFASPEDLKQAIKLGQTVGIFESEDYIVFAETNKIVFEPDRPNQQRRFVSVLKQNNKCTDKPHILFSVW